MPTNQSPPYREVWRVSQNPKPITQMIDYQQIIDEYYPESENAALRKILMVHSRSVADMALECIDRHPELTIDRDFVEAAAMLHDIGVCMCDAKDVECYGSSDYMLHGRCGADLLRLYASTHGISEEEIEPYTRVCERHTGAGLTIADIIAQKLPLPAIDLVPETLEEKLVCYADKFFSKTHIDTRKPLEKVEKSIARFGEGGLKRFKEWHGIFG